MTERKPIYAVIRVDQYYDDVEGAECLASFPTREEAEKHVQEIKDERDRLYRENQAYIDRFVEAIEVPKTDYAGWVAFLKQFSFFGDRYILPQDFKYTMKSYLREQVPPLAGFNPPPVKHGFNNLFVVVV